jgi:hypothetical protein
MSTKVRAAAIALGGMIAGALVGIGVQFGVESTGMLGPSVDELMAEQEANFEDVQARLEELRNASSDPQMVAGIDALQALLEKQQSLQQNVNNEVGYLSNQMEQLREESLAANGFAGGAGVWLGAGESISVGDKSHVFGVTRVNRGTVNVTLNGKASQMGVGAVLSATTDAGECQVFYRQATPREDGKVGFDVVCA